jgi:transcriptional regulator with XRE-family HTH domain
MKEIDMSIKRREGLLPSKPEVISGRIKDTREKRGLTASELARLVGVTPTAVWNWEKNSITPRRPALEAVAKVLGVTTAFLVYGAETEVTARLQPTASVASILDDARVRLAEATGLAVDRIKLNLQFVTE